MAFLKIFTLVLSFFTAQNQHLRVFKDLFLATDTGDHTVLVLLDRTAVFDTVDHNILISRLEHCVGIRGTSLKWFWSYLSERSFSVSLTGHQSTLVFWFLSTPGFYRHDGSALLH